MTAKYTEEKGVGSRILAWWIAVLNEVYYSKNSPLKTEPQIFAHVIDFDDVQK